MPGALAAISGGLNLVGGLMGMLGRRRQHKAAMHRYNNYNNAIARKGLDQPIDMRFGDAYGTARLMTDSARLGRQTSLNNRISSRNRRARREGLNIGALSEINSADTNRTFTSGASQTAGLTQHVARQMYQRDRNARRRQLNYLKQKYYHKPAKLNPYNQIGSVISSVAGGAGQYANMRNRNRMTNRFFDYLDTTV